MLKIPTLEEGVGIKGINTNVVYHSTGFVKHAWLPQCTGQQPGLSGHVAEVVLSQA